MTIQRKQTLLDNIKDQNKKFGIVVCLARTVPDKNKYSIQVIRASDGDEITLKLKRSWRDTKILARFLAEWMGWAGPFYDV